ncbi:hypothetical protein [Streptosporangium minutum]|uniref:hypothetical protein n=1 Tax=Streptosporangium minutum TaxID=569862 RepID=UPI001F613751|nr:hypothetical protein [Streptosporangium minutum]
MPDLLWDEVRSFFDPDLMRTLPDVRVTDTLVGDWQVVLDLIEAQGWRSEYSEGDIVMPLPRAEQVLSLPADADCPSLRIWPAPDVPAIFRFLSEDTIDFDIDLRELQGQERLNLLCGFFVTIGRKLGKPVLMSPESDPDHPVLGFEVGTDRVVLPADPWPADHRCGTGALEDPNSQPSDEK